MAPLSNGQGIVLIASDRLQMLGETEASGAEVQLAEGYPSRRCANGVTGPRRTLVRWGLCLSTIGHRSHA